MRLEAYFQNIARLQMMPDEVNGEREALQERITPDILQKSCVEFEIEYPTSNAN